MYRQIYIFAKRFGTGSLAQALTFLSAFIPVVFRDGDALVLLVSSGSLSTFLVSLFSFSAQSTIPSARTPRQAIARTHLALMGLLSAFTLGFVLVFFVSGFFRVFFLVSTLLIVTQGLFSIVLGLASRFEVVHQFQKARLVYALTLFVGNLGCGFLSASSLAYGLVPSVAFLLGTVFFIIGCSFSNSPWPAQSLLTQTTTCSLLAELRSQFRLVIALSLGSFSTQLSGMMVNFLGPFSEVWSIVVRISSGFQTIGGQVFAPDVISRLIRARADNDNIAMLSAIRYGQFFGILLSASMVVVTAISLLWQDNIVLSLTQWVFIALCILFDQVSTVFSSPTSRLLEIGGAASTRVFWEISRLLTSVLLLTFLAQPFWIFLQSLSTVLFRIIYQMLLPRKLG